MKNYNFNVGVIETRPILKQMCILNGVKWIPFLPKYFIRLRLLRAIRLRCEK